MSTTNADLHPYIQEDERFDSRFVARVRGIWLGGGVFAIFVSLVQNVFGVVRASLTGDSPTTARAVAENLQFGINAAEATTLSVGLLAGTATLAVAVVASTWRPITEDPRTEVPVDRAVALFVRGGQISAGVAVAVTILVIPQMGVAVVCAAIALVASVVSAAVSEREDELRRALQFEYKRRYLGLLEARAHALFEKRPWVKGKQHETWRSVALYSAHWITTIAAALIVVLVALLVGYPNPEIPALSVLLVGSLTAVIATLCTYLTAAAVKTQWAEGELQSARIYRILAVFLGLLSLFIILGLAWEKDQVVLKIVAALPMASFLALTALGAAGRGPGQSLWTSAAARILKSVEEQVEELGGAKLADDEAANGDLLRAAQSEGATASPDTSFNRSSLTDQASLEGEPTLSAEDAAATSASARSQQRMPDGTAGPAD